MSRYRERGSLAAEGGLGRSILDIPIRITWKFFGGEKIKKSLSRTSRKLFNRMMLGLKIKARYYFLTLTSANLYPDCWDLEWRNEKSRYKLLEDWDPLRKWLKSKDPGCSWCYCFTDEGYGVIHMILRRSKKGSRIEVTELRKYWERRHGAKQVRIERVGVNHGKLVRYISDQRKGRKIAGEFAWQETIVRWRWSEGWIPFQYCDVFGKTWLSWSDADNTVREQVIRDDVRVWHDFITDGTRFSRCPFYHGYLLYNLWRASLVEIKQGEDYAKV